MSLLRSTPRTLYTRLVRHAQAVYIPRRQFANGGYSDDTSHPKGKHPNKQGPNPSADIEHLRSPVSSTSTTGTGKGHNTSQNQRDQKRSFSTLVSRQFNTGPAHFADGGKGSRPKSTKGLSPKILNKSLPPEGKASEDVKKHNEELEHRAERVHERFPNEDEEKDKIDKEFLTGEFVRGAVIHVTVAAFVALLIECW